MGINGTGKFLQEARQERGLSPQALAALVGYSNVNRGANRILRFEAEGVVTKDLLDKLIHALDLDPVRVQDLVDEDRRALHESWSEWAAEPVPFRLTFKAIPGFWCGKRLPPDLTREAAIACARNEAMRALPEQIYCLELSRRESWWFYPDGRSGRMVAKGPEDLVAPYMTVGSSRVKVLIIERGR